MLSDLRCDPIGHGVDMALHSSRMRLKAIFTLFAVYAVTAAPAFLPGEWKVIVQPATEDAVEVYYQPVSPVLLRSYEGIRPFQRALEAAERRAKAFPHDLAPPYILHEPYRLIAPYVTTRGRELASPLIGTAGGEQPGRATSVGGDGRRAHSRTRSFRHGYQTTTQPGRPPNEFLRPRPTPQAGQAIWQARRH
jgi:hypothetical protein